MALNSVVVRKIIFFLTYILYMKLQYRIYINAMRFEYLFYANLSIYLTSGHTSQINCSATIKLINLNYGT